MSIGFQVMLIKNVFSSFRKIEQTMRKRVKLIFRLGKLLEIPVQQKNKEYKQATQLLSAV